jgi:hypothetical protein
MKVMCKTGSTKSYTIELSKDEGHRLSDLFRKIDPYNLALQIVYDQENDFPDLGTEMTREEVSQVVQAYQDNMVEAMHDYGLMLKIIGELSYLDRM